MEGEEEPEDEEEDYAAEEGQLRPGSIPPWKARRSPGGPRPPATPPPGSAARAMGAMAPTSKAKARHPPPRGLRPSGSGPKPPTFAPPSGPIPAGSALRGQEATEEDEEVGGEEDGWEEDDDWEAEEGDELMEAQWDEWNGRQSKKTSEDGKLRPKAMKIPAFNPNGQQAAWKEDDEEEWEEEEEDRGRNRRKSKGKGKGKDKEAERGKKKKRPQGVKEDAPERFDGDLWEEGKDEAGLALVEDMAPKQYKWTYPMMDHSRRSYAGFLPSPMNKKLCNTFYEKIKDGTNWLQPEGPSGRAIPRKTAWMVKKGCDCMYRYGQVEVPPADFPPWMIELMSIVMPACGLADRADWPDSCNMNHYVDGGMSVGWHSDDESLFQGKYRDILIISLSLGVKRNFELRLNWPDEGEQPLRQFQLGSGDIMTMEGMTQKHFMHRVPREELIEGSRINLTWRWVVKHTAKCPASRQR